jgi:enoyl-CoA hydratase/carnithine racemase
MSPVTYEIDGRVAIITLRRPQRRNAINAEATALLHDAWKRFSASDARVAIITGEGDHFCAGVDVTDASKEAWKGVPNVGVMLDKPLVSAVNGSVVGAGFTLTMMSDLCIADDTARFIFPEAKVGMFGGITASLVGRVPQKIANEFLMLGEPMEARRAYEVGMINRVVPKGEHQQAALEMAHRLAGLAPLVLQTIKRDTLATLPKSPAESAYPAMGRLQALSQSEDAKEGPRAFREKRTPDFKGQ